MDHKSKSQNLFKKYNAYTTIAT